MYLLNTRIIIYALTFLKNTFMVDRVKDKIRLKHWSYQTEKSHIVWIKS